MYRGIGGIALLACAAASFGQTPAKKAVPAKTKASASSRQVQVFQKACGQCHPRDFVFAPRSRDQWQETIQKMATLGAKGSDEEFAIVLDYLAAEYGRRPSQRPAIFLLVTAWLLINTLITSPVQTMIGLGLMALGLPVYWHWSQKASPRA